MVDNVELRVNEKLKSSQLDLPLYIVELLNEGRSREIIELFQQKIANEQNPQEKATLLQHLIGVCAVNGGSALDNIPSHLNEILKLRGFSKEAIRKIVTILGPIMDPEKVKQEDRIVLQTALPEVTQRVGPPKIHFKSFKFTEEPDSKGWFVIEGRNTLHGLGIAELLLRPLFGRYYAKRGKITPFVEETAGRSILDFRNVRGFSIDPSGRYKCQIRSEGDDSVFKSVFGPSFDERKFIDKTETGFVFRYIINTDRSFVITDMALPVYGLNEYQVSRDLVEKDATVEYLETSSAQGLSCGLGHSHPWPSFFSLLKGESSDQEVGGDFAEIFYNRQKFQDQTNPLLQNTTTANLVLIGYNKGFLYTPNRGITLATLTPGV